MQPIKIGEILGIAWDKFSAKPGLCIGTFLTYLAISFAAGIAEVLFEKIVGFNPHIISILVGAFASFGSTLIMIDIALDRPTSIGRFFEVIELYPKAFGQYILNILALLLGLILLVVPGIIVNLGFSMGIYLILERKAGIIESFKMSWAMTRGYKWKLFFISILFLLINLVGVIFLVVGLFVTIPITAIAMAEIFKRLLANHEMRMTTGENPCQI